jgi:hypothetical protein
MTTVWGHMNMAHPIPRGHKALPGIPPGQIDYSITTPAAGPCQNKPANAPVQTLRAGSSIQTTLEGGATHGGGHCQFALSYDQRTWVVLKTVVNSCLVDGLSYSVPLPSSAPSSNHAVYAWTWINRIGNREYYWNCADVKIEGGGGKLSGPELLVVDLPGHTVVPEFGNGPDTVGIKLLDARKTISVSGGQIDNGSTGTAPPGSPSGTPGTSGNDPPPGDTPIGSTCKPRASILHALVFW